MTPTELHVTSGAHTMDRAHIVQGAFRRVSIRPPQGATTDNPMNMTDLPQPQPAASAASDLDRMNRLVDASIPTANNVRSSERAAHVGVRVTAIPLPNR